MKDKRYLRISYFQKSKILFSLIAGKKYYQTVAPSLINTYLFCNFLNESILDYYLFAEFEPNTELDPEILTYLYAHYTTDNGKELYIFDMTAFKEEIDKFLEGHYSEFSEEAKDRILYYYGYYSKDFKGKYIKSINIHEMKGFLHFYSILYPEDCKEAVAEEMVNLVCDNKEEAMTILSEMKELCEIYDKEKETFKEKIIGITD